MYVYIKELKALQASSGSWNRLLKYFLERLVAVSSKSVAWTLLFYKQTQRCLQSILPIIYHEPQVVHSREDEEVGMAPEVKPASIFPDDDWLGKTMPK